MSFIFTQIRLVIGKKTSVPLFQTISEKIKKKENFFINQLLYESSPKSLFPATKTQRLKVSQSIYYCIITLCVTWCLSAFVAFSHLNTFQSGLIYKTPPIKTIIA